VAHQPASELLSCSERSEIFTAAQRATVMAVTLFVGSLPPFCGNLNKLKALSGDTTVNLQLQRCFRGLQRQKRMTFHRHF
jgi:hypothetical protein